MELGPDWGRGNRREEVTQFRGSGSPGSFVVLESCGLTPGTLIQLKLSAFWQLGSPLTTCLSFPPLSAFPSSKQRLLLPPDSSCQQQDWERG